jgi:hypothetical protein
MNNTRVLSKEIPSRIRRPVAPDNPDLQSLRKVLPGELARSGFIHCDKIANKCGALALMDLAELALEAALGKAVANWEFGYVECTTRKYRLVDIQKRASTTLRKRHEARDRAKAKADADCRAVALEKQAAEQRLTKVAADLSQRLAKTTHFDDVLPIMLEASALKAHGHDVFMAALDKFAADAHRLLDMVEKQNRDWGIGPKAPDPAVAEMSKINHEYDIWRGGGGGENPFNRTVHRQSS